MSAFTAFDVETANPDLATICQVGIVVFDDGKIVDRWESLVDPEDYFDEWHVDRHGIDEATVRGAPTFVGLHRALTQRLSGRLVASHMPFDRLAIDRACNRYRLQPIEYPWLDTARVVRRTWPQFTRTGYNLANITAACGIEFQHHHAVEDARAAGLVLLRAMEVSGLSLSEWQVRAQQRISPQASESFAQAGNPDGPLYGEVIVFTGALDISRREAAQLAAEAGCEVGEGVTKHTTLLVVGDQDIRRLAGHEKSTKHRKAEELIARGHEIRILRESDFRQLMRS